MNAELVMLVLNLEIQEIGSPSDNERSSECNIVRIDLNGMKIWNR